MARSATGGETPEFLVIGHAVQDLVDDGGSGRAGWRLGGAATYASLLARNLGLRTAVLTSASPEIDLAVELPGIEVVCLPSEESTQFRNVYDGGRRRQFLPRRASPIGADDLPEDWRGARIVLLGPVAGEVDPALAGCFPGALLGVGAQGWLREVGPDTAVQPVAPEAWDAEEVLSHADALFLSDEDVPAHAAPAALEHWSGMVETVAFTRGYGGAYVCHKGEWRHIDAFPAKAVDPTGAGDVFAAAFLIRFLETADAWESARFAAGAASFVVEGEGASLMPDRRRIQERLRQNPDIIAR